MPYTHRKVGDKECVFKKDGGAKVGCTKGSINKYLAALYANVDEGNSIKGGKSDNMSIKQIADKFDKSVDDIKAQIKKGISVEMEHTSDKEKATEIVMDHLSEFPDYYDRLKKMEDKAKKEFTNESRKKFIKTLLREGLFDDIPDSDFIKAYTNKINMLDDNLLTKMSTAENYVFILGNKVKKNLCGEPNKCETNTWSFIKEKLEQGETNFYPVGGYMFIGQNLNAIEHWWVYDSDSKQFLEVTPGEGVNPRCYAGIINTQIQNEILNSKYFYDIDFFKGGHIYSKYIKYIK
jgi:hypothetical protein